MSGTGDGGYGEGLEYLGFDDADATGNWIVAGVTAALGGQEVSAIAIDASNDTSEFGANVTVCVDSDGDGLCDLEEDANTDLDGDPTTIPGPDTDGDSFPNYLDADDDEDVTATSARTQIPMVTVIRETHVDSDRDGEPDYLDAPTIGSGGSVASAQKISETAGGFGPALSINDHFGRSVASIGDIDGDGIVDLAVGAPFDDDGGSDHGAVYILFLNADGTVRAKQKISDTEGGFAAPLANLDEFGMGVAGLGDLDGDGINDIAVGAHQDDDGVANAGAVYILFLRADGTVKSEQKISATVGGLTGPLSINNRFGSSVAQIGDLDGDGLNDLVVGAKDDDDGAVDGGAVYVLFLNADGTVKGEQKISALAGGFTGPLTTNDRFGIGVASLGDLDGDGNGDIAVGALYDDDGGTDRGAVYVLRLNADGTVKAEQKISDTEGGFGGVLDNNDEFGTAVSGVGDVDADGVPDLAVGTPKDDDTNSLSGAVYLLFLNANGTVKSEQKISNLEGGLAVTLSTSDQFGFSVAGIGDLDGDGRIDIAVGVYGDDDGGPADRGAVYVLQLGPTATISGVVFEDIVGDALSVGAIGDATNPGAAGVTVNLYRDDGNGIPDAADAFEASDVTDGTGAYGFTGLPSAADYWVVVDSSTVPASGGYNATYVAADAVPDQTYGPAGSLCADAAAWGTTSPVGAAGPCYGGRQVTFVGTAGSDDLATWHSGSEHLALVDLDGGSVADANFGFSFNVVVGRHPDVDAAAEQGSFDQFLQNANAIAGANPMRFVPAGPTNAAATGAAWWLLQPAAALTEINDADTTVDGTAYSTAGVERDDNPGSVGTGGFVGAGDVPFAQIARSELQIDGAGLVIIDDAAASLVPHRVKVRALSITDAGSEAIRVNTISQAAPVADDLLFEDLILGMPPVWQPQLLPSSTSAGIHLNATNRAVIQDSFIGWTNGRTVNVETSTDAIVRRSELRDTGEDVTDIYGDSTGTLFEENRISGGLNFGIDLISGPTTIRNNTIDGVGDGAGQTGGIRAYGAGSIIDRNVFSNNLGPAIAVNGTMTAPARVAGAAVITQNEFVNNSGLSIDLVPATEDNLLSGDGITPNDGDALPTSFGNHEIDFPVISSASVADGTTTLEGTACSGCTIEIYKAVGGTGDDDPPGSTTNYHGEGNEYLGAGVATGGTFSIDVTGLVAGDEVSATATDTVIGITSEFSLNDTVVVPPGGVSGTVFEDIAGNALDGTELIGDINNPLTSGVDVYLYADDGGSPDVPDATDAAWNGGVPVATNGSGAYSFAGLPDGTYWVVADSKTVGPAGGYNGAFGIGDVWADQTYGAGGGWCADGAGGTVERASADTCFGGRDGADSDIATALTTAEHVARVEIVGGAPVANVSFGFSFNAVTNAGAATAAAVTGRSAQGSLDQFIRNANAIVGANAMRFVPAVPQNDGSGSWWRIDYSASVDPLRHINDAGTAIDGTAYDLADAVSVVDSNADFLGANAAGGLNVGVDVVSLPQVAKPELEIRGDGLDISVAGALIPSGTTIQDVSVWDDSAAVLIGAGAINNVVLQRLVVGTPPDTFADPGNSGTGALDGIRIRASGTGGVIANNLVGFVDTTGVHLETATNGWSVTGNEVRATGRVSTSWDGVLIWGTNTTVSGNLITANNAFGIDVNSANVGGNTIENNDLTGNGLAGIQTGGMRMGNDQNVARKNVITGNSGPGIVVYELGGTADSADANEITENRFGGNGGPAIDLALTAAGAAIGDGINVPNDGVNGNAGNQGLDHPVITSAVWAAGSTTLQGTACNLCDVEVYLAAAGAGDTVPPGPNAGDYGEGLTYVTTATADGSGNWTTVAAGVALDDTVSAIAIDAAKNTSEFGPNVVANGPPVLAAVGNQSGDELTLITFDADASDPNLGDTLTFSLANSPPAGASINPTTGVFSWTPTEAQGPGPYTFDVVVTDNGTPNLADSETIQVTVDEVNVAPVVTNPGDQGSAESDVVSLPIAASDADDPSNTLTYSATGLPPGLSINSGTGEISGVILPTAGAGSPYSVAVRATDNGTPNLFHEVTFQWTISNTNRAPVLDPITDPIGDELTSITFDADASDPDLPPDGLTFSLSGTVPTGAAINPTTGVFTWTPTEAQGYATYTFDVVVTDDGTPAMQDQQTITVTVNEVNVAPVLAAIGNKTVDELVALGFTASATDADDPANTLTFSLVGAPAGASIDPVSGVFSWTPTETDEGLHSFDVVVTDNGTPNRADSETIQVTVNEVNVAPVLAAIGNKTVDELVALGFTASATDVDDPANTLTFSLGNSPPGGASINPTTGVFSWTPTEAQGPGLYTFDVIVTDDGAPNRADSETIQVTVDEADTAPTLAAIGNQTIDELTAATFTASATDPDVPGSLTYSLSGAPGGASINPTSGAFSWTPTEAQGPGGYTFDVVVTDNTTLTDTESVTITVDEVNLNPDLGAVGNRSVAEGSTLTFTAAATDGDLPANSLTYFVAGAVPPGATMNPTSGAFSYTPAEADGPGSYAMTVGVTDGVGGVDSEVITITVNETNLPPSVTNPGPQSDAEADSVSLAISASDPDVPANSLTYTATGLPPGLSIAPLTGAISGTVGATAAAGSPYSVTVRATDDGSPNLFDEAAFTWTITDTNRAPVLGAIGNQTVDELTALTFTAAATDPDLPADGLTFSLAGAPGGASINPASGAFTWTPSEVQGPGTYVFDVIVTDDGSPVLDDSETISVTVDEVDTTPVLGAIGNKTVDELTLLSFTAAAVDPDVPGSISFSLAGSPPSGASINPTSGLFSWTPTEAQGPGLYSFDIVVTDNTALADSETISVTVDEVDTPPVLGSIGNQTVDELTPLTFTAAATDPDVPGSLTFTLAGSPPTGASINPTTGAFSWTPTEAQGPAGYTFDVVVTDNTALFDSETITVTVAEVNVAPAVTNPGPQTDVESGTVSLTVAASDADVPANALLFSQTGLPPGLSINPGTGEISGTISATAAAGSPYGVTVRATDNGSPSLFDEVAFTWTITDTNQAPVLDPIADPTGDELTAIAFTATATDPDLPANALAFSLVGAPTGASIDPVTGDFTWTPTEAQGFATYTFDVVVTDNGTPVLADSETITVTVDEVNVAPVLAGVGDRTVDEQTLLAFTATATDVDLPANALAFSLVGAPTGASIDPVTGDFTWTPTEAQGFATYTFDVVVTDNGTPVLADSETITVTVDEVNVAPVLAGVGDRTVDEQTLLAFTATATDVDLPANALVFSLVGAPTGCVD